MNPKSIQRRKKDMPLENRRHLVRQSQRGTKGIITAKKSGGGVVGGAGGGDETIRGGEKKV